MGDCIFLSYARDDDETFVRALYTRLAGEGLDVWFDRECMPSRSLTFLQEIRDEIRRRDRVVVVLGPSAVRSDYVRAEWQAGLVDGKVVTPVLRLGEYDILPPELSNLHCPDVRPERPLEEAFAEVLRVLRDPVPPLGTLVGSVPSVPAHFQPRPDDLSRLAGTILYEVQHPVVLDPPLRTTVLHGMGGVGKSVLAASFARSTTTRRVFTDGVVWVDLTPTSTPMEVVRGVLAAVAQPLGPHASLGEAVTLLRGWLESRRCLLVLDNLWSVPQAAPILQAVSPVSRLLITSRDEGIAAGLGCNVQLLETLSEEAALTHLADWVGSERDALPDDARAVAKQCGGLPFALALQGALAHHGVPWADLLAALHEADLTFARQVFPDYPYLDVLATIEVSLDQLRATDDAAADRMLELGAFVWGEGVPADALFAFWGDRVGLSPRHGRRLLVELERKALIRLDGDPWIVRIHDLVVDYLTAKSVGRGLDRELVESYRDRCPDDWPSGPDDGYFHRHLVDHLAAQPDGGEELERLLRLTTAQGRNAWFEASDRAGHLDAYRRQLERQIHDPENGIGMVSLLVAKLASVNSLAGMLPPSIATAMVRTGAWTHTQALNYVRQALDPAARAAGLVRLMDEHGGAAGELLDEAAAAARELEEVPLELVPLVDALARGGRDVEALVLARRAGPGDPRTTALAAVAAHLEEPDRSAVVEEAIETASLTGGAFRAAAIEPILPLLTAQEIASLEARAVEPLVEPSAKSSCQELIVYRLLELGENGEAWTRARSIVDPLSQAGALARCLPTRPADERVSVVDEVLDAVTSADTQEIEARLAEEFAELPAILRGFLPRFVATQPVRSSLLSEVTDWISPQQTAVVVDALLGTKDTLFAAEGAAALDPVLADETRARLLDHIETRVADITREEERVRARAALVTLAPDARRVGALDALLSEVDSMSVSFQASSMTTVASVVEGAEIERAIDVADRIVEPEPRAAAMETLIGKASPEQLARAASAVTTLRDDQSITWAAAALAPGLDRATRIDLLDRSASYDDYPRARIAALVTAALEDADLPSALAVADALEAPGALAEILLPALAARSTGPARGRLLERGIRIAARMTDPERRIWALEALIEHFDEGLHETAFRAFTEGEAGVGDEWVVFGRALLLAVTAPHRPDPQRSEFLDEALALVPDLDDVSSRRDVLARLAAHLDARQWQTAGGLIAAEDDPYERAMTCGFVLQDAPEALRPALVHEAMRDFEAIQETDFSSLWERQQGAVARILAYTEDPLGRLHLVERMDSEAWKRAALREYCRVTASSEFGRIRTLIDTLPDPRDRASLEMAMANRLGAEDGAHLLTEALEHALDGQADLWHDRLLPGLATALCTLPRDRLATLWRTHVSRLAAMSREQMAAQIHGLAPMIVRAGAAGAMARSVLDVERWWP